MNKKDYLEELRPTAKDSLAARLIAAFEEARDHPGAKPADVITRLKEEMDAALEAPHDASS